MDKDIMKNIFCRSLAIVLIGTMIHMTTIGQCAAFSIGEERQLGEKLLYTVRSAFEVMDDPDIHQYINDLGKQVLDVAGTQYFDYRFYVINNKEFNAFAAPSGLIFFHSGLIATMNSEDELLSVLAHEIGHIHKRHLASRVEKGSIVNLTTLGLALAAIALGGGGEATQAILATSLATGQSINLHFSRQDEEEADLMAYDWMKTLHRNPEAQLHMLQTMRRITRYRMGQVPQYLLTHPNPEARMSYVESLIDAKGEDTAAYENVDNTSFLRFKYRIMSQVKDRNAFRTYLNKKIGDENSTEDDIHMAQYGLAQLAKTENSFDESLKLMDEVLSFYPRNNDFLVDKGIVQMRAGQQSQALSTLKLAYSRDRTSMYATFSLGQILMQMGQLSEAEHYFKMVEHAMPEYAQLYYDLGKLTSHQGKHGESLLYLGKYYLYSGKMPLAKHHLDGVLKAKNIPAEMTEEAQRLLAVIKRIEKG